MSKYGRRTDRKPKEKKYDEETFFKENRKESLPY